jgi:hypothetical protein
MAIPTITTVTPAVIFSGGQLVTIQGTNFQTPYPPGPATGPLPPPLPTVTVTIGGRVAKNVVVTSATSLTCWARPLNPSANVPITLQNLDATGAAIPGETVTVLNRLKVQRADLAIEADLTRLERALILELQRQVLENAFKTTSVDFDGTPAGAFDEPDVAKLPALAIQGPQLVDDHFYDGDLGFVEVTGATYVKHRTLKTVNLTYRFVAMDNKGVRNMNLMALMLQFLQNNKYLEMRRDEADPSKGIMEYEMEQVGEFTTFTGSSNSDIRGFSGSLVIRGFQLGDAAGFIDQTVAERGRTVDTVTVEPPSNFLVPSGG